MPFWNKETMAIKTPRELWICHTKNEKLYRPKKEVESKSYVHVRQSTSHLRITI